MKFQLKKVGKTLLVIVILILPLMVSAQNWDTPVIDKFTNDTIYSTTMETVASSDVTGEYLMVYFSRIKDDVYLNLKVQVSTSNHNYFGVGGSNNILVKLENTKIIYLSNSGNVVASQDGAYWMLNLEARIPYNDMSDMTDANFSAIRIIADSQNIDFNIDPKDGLTMEKMLFLIMTGVKYKD